MKISAMLAGLGLLAALGLSGCSHASGPEVVKMKANESQPVSGGKATLAFNGAPYGSAAVELKCGEEAGDSAELAQGESLDACGVHVVCVKISRSNYGSDTATFEVSAVK